jgi:hypothetical protein
MTNNDYYVVENNIVTNLVVWDGNANVWSPPENSIMLVRENTLTKIWVINQARTDFDLEESAGDADIGFTWDGTFLTTNKPKPELPVV